MNTLLSRVVYDRKEFDPFDRDHLLAYKYFIENRKWNGNCPFHLLWPHDSVPEMIKTKLVNTFIDVMIEHVENNQHPLDV